MNKNRRKEIDYALEQLEYVNICDVRNLVEEIRYDELESYDEIPENLQTSPKAEAIEESLDHLNDVQSYISDIEVSIDEIRSSLESAKGV